MNTDVFNTAFHDELDKVATCGKAHGKKKGNLDKQMIARFGSKGMGKTAMGDDRLAILKKNWAAKKKAEKK
jgi:hypothetical protein